MDRTPDIRAAALERRRLARGSASASPLRPLILPSLVLVAGLVITGLVFHLTWTGAEAEARRDFERRANEHSIDFRASLDGPLTVLESIPALKMAAREVDRGGFRAFVTPALRRHPSITALEWVPYVVAGQRAQYEAQARADGLTNFVFTELAPDGSLVPAAEREVYAPIYFMEPEGGPALGFDILSETGRRATAVRSMSRGTVVASPRFQLVEDPEGVYSLAVYHPVYATFPPPTSETERLRTFQGFAVEIVRIDEALRGDMQELAAQGIDLLLIDESADDERALLFESQPGLYANTPAEHWVWNSEFDFADRHYTLGFVAGEALMDAVTPPWLLLIGGLALSLLTGFGLWAVRSMLRLRTAMARALRLGRYTLVEKLGQGGMGVVYRARHAMLRRPTALKLLRADNETRMARFEREVQQTSRLTHPNTIAIYDYGRTPDGIFYYAMEYLDGITLDELVRLDGPQPPERVVHILGQVCGALAEAHAAGLIHRDIKPANIMLTRRGGIYDFVKVLDFGLVKEVASSDDVQLSSDAAFLGTPLYLSPEAIEEPDEMDGRADLYAVGAVGYVLLTGEPVFLGKSKLAVLSQHLSAEPEAPSERLGRPIPQGLEMIILSCLAKTPSARPPSAGDLHDALRQIDGLPRWRQSQAAHWWHDRGVEVVEAARVARRAELTEASRPTHQTVDINLDERATSRR